MPQDARKHLVIKANDLIQKSRFSLTLQQQKIVLYLISQIHPNDTDFKKYSFSIPEFCRVTGISRPSGEDYTAFKNDIKAIADKSLWVTLEDGSEPLLRWIAKPTIRKDSGTIEVQLDEDMKPFLLELKKNFTAYELIYTLHFRSKYSLRLYELVKSIHFHEIEIYNRTYPLDELKRLLDAETYEQYRDFRTRVLEPAIKELNKYSDKNIEYRPIKRGRSVAQIELTISTKKPMERLRIRDQVEKDLGGTEITLFDELTMKGMV